MLIVCFILTYSCISQLKYIFQVSNSGPSKNRWTTNNKQTTVERAAGIKEEPHLERIYSISYQ